jgi:hypothetical protein
LTLNAGGEEGNQIMKADRIEFLKQKERDIRAALAVEQVKLVRRQKLLAEKEQSLIGMAVVKAAALSPEFKLAVAQVALVGITDEKQRRFLAERGWNI